MNPNNSKILSQIPEYLIDPLEEEVDLPEILENLKPNSVNVIASLMERIREDLPWISSKESPDGASVGMIEAHTPSDNVGDPLLEVLRLSHLDQVFESLNKRSYKVSEPELLKGFFTFKGTEVDLQYLAKISGYKVEVFDSTFIVDGVTLFELLTSQYGAVFQSIRSLINQEELETKQNLIKVHQINNGSPLLINNLNDRIVNRTMTVDQMATFFGWPTLTTLQRSSLNEIFEILRDTRQGSFSVKDCAVTAHAVIDLDLTSEVVIGLRGIYTQIRNFIGSRLCLGVYLDAVIPRFEASDSFNPRDSITSESYFSRGMTGVDTWGRNSTREYAEVTNSTKPLSELVYFKDISSPHMRNSAGGDNAVSLPPPYTPTALFPGGFSTPLDGTPINNANPRKIEGRRPRVNESQRIRDNEPFITDVSGVARFKVLNAHPYKVRGDLFRIILDNAFYVEVNRT